MRTDTSTHSSDSLPEDSSHALPLAPGRYLGHALRHHQGEGFSLTESAYEPDARLPEHSHTRAHFCLVVSGRYTERLQDGECLRRPGDLVFYPPESRHAEIHHENGRHLMIEVESTLLDRLGDAPGSVRACAPDASRTASTLHNELHRLAHERGASTAGVRLVLEGLMLELLGRLAASAGEEPVEAPEWLLAALDHARETMPQPPGLEELARRVGVHATHLARTMRRCRGESYGEMIRRLRLDRARRLLVDTDLPIAEVALESGFCDQSHLTRSVRSAWDTTPAALRRSRR